MKNKIINAILLFGLFSSAIMSVIFASKSFVFDKKNLSEKNELYEMNKSMIALLSEVTDSSNVRFFSNQGLCINNHLKDIKTLLEQQKNCISKNKQRIYLSYIDSIYVKIEEISNILNNKPSSSDHIIDLITDHKGIHQNILKDQTTNKSYYSYYKQNQNIDSLNKIINSIETIHFDEKSKLLNEVEKLNKLIKTFEKVKEFHNSYISNSIGAFAYILIPFEDNTNAFYKKILSKNILDLYELDYLKNNSPIVYFEINGVDYFKPKKVSVEIFINNEIMDIKQNIHEFSGKIFFQVNSSYLLNKDFKILFFIPEEYNNPLLVFDKFNLS